MHRTQKDQLKSKRNFLLPLGFLLTVDVVHARDIELDLSAILDRVSEGQTSVTPGDRTMGEIWLATSENVRLGLLAGVFDAIVALGTISLTTKVEALKQGADPKVIDRADWTFERMYFRFNKVKQGQSPQNIVDAVTEFYKTHPLQRNHSPTWVLLVPLFDSLGKPGANERVVIPAKP